MSNELEILLDEIQAKHRLTLDEIADKIGYSRPYISRAKNKGTNTKLIAILKDEFGETQKDTKVERADTDIVEILREQNKMLAEQVKLFSQQIALNLNTIQTQQMIHTALLKVNVSTAGRVLAAVVKEDEGSVLEKINKEISREADIQTGRTVGI